MAEGWITGEEDRKESRGAPQIGGPVIRASTTERQGPGGAEECLARDVDAARLERRPAKCGITFHN